MLKVVNINKALKKTSIEYWPANIYDNLDGGLVLTVGQIYENISHSQYIKTISFRGKSNFY